MSLRYLFGSLLFCVLFLVFSIDAFGCSCRARPTVLDSYEEAKNVISVKVVSIEKGQENEPIFNVGNIRSATVIVTKVHKGELKPGNSIKFGQGGGGDCVWTFSEESVGEEFLFYVGKPTKGYRFAADESDNQKEEMFHAGTCGRSSSLASAKDDLAYLENMEKVKGKTRLSGMLDTWVDDDFPRQGIEIVVSGEKKIYKAKTDKDGFFQIYDIPEGNYSANIKIPRGWKINSYMLGRTTRGYEDYDPDGAMQGKNVIPVRIEKGRHTGLDLIFDIDTAIQGRILSPTGKPMKNVCVKAASTYLKQGDYRGRSDCTNAKGEFSIEEMADGNYILVANDDGRIDADEPFGTVFYPGASEIKTAAVVAVEKGKYISNIVIQIPQLTELITFSGRVLYSDGKPASERSVKFHPIDKKSFDDMSQTTDENGNFAFSIPKGAAGTVAAEMSTYKGMYEDCRELDEMFQKAGKTWLTLKTNEVLIDGLVNPLEMQLAFPIPFCQESKDK